MITKESLENFVKVDKDNKWEEVNLLIDEGDNRSIEKFLSDLLKSDLNNFSNKFVLNLIYVLAHIRNVDSLDVLLEIGRKLENNKLVMLEVLDAIGDIVYEQEIPKYVSEMLDKFLNKEINIFESDSDILSSIAYVLNNLRPELKLKEKKQDFHEYSAAELKAIF